MLQRTLLCFVLVYCLVVSLIGCGERARTVDEKAPAHAEVTSCEITLTGQMNGRSIVKYSGGTPVRVKTFSDGGRWLLHDLEQRLTYSGKDGRSQCFRMKLSPGFERGIAASSPVEKRRHGKEIGTEVVDDVECRILQFDEFGSEQRIFVGKKDGLCRKALGVVKGTTVLYSRVNAVPDGEFDLPPGLTFFDI